MYLRDLGEFGIIAHIRGMFPFQKALLGVGDDCAIFEGRKGFWSLITVDSQVEGTHFCLSFVPPKTLGRRLLRVNLSDVAAMGGIPRYALASFVLREDVQFDWFKEVLEGIREEAESNGMEIIGGNLARTRGEMVFDIVVLGEVEQDRPLLLRRNARAGDIIFVTGYPGEAKAGLLLAEKGSDPGVYRPLLERFLLPEPRLQVGRFLGEFGTRIALIDISDGFLQDLGHILEESGIGALLFRGNIPISSLLAQFCKAEQKNPLEFVFQGGEDFELIFTVPRNLADVVERDFRGRLNISLHRVGEIVEGRGIFLEEDGRISPLSLRGWDHFTPKGEA